MIDIGKLITKLRNAPQLVGTFGRGDPDPLDEYRPGMTGEERGWLVQLLEVIEDVSDTQKALRALAEHMRTTGEFFSSERE